MKKLMILTFMLLSSCGETTAPRVTSALEALRGSWLIESPGYTVQSEITTTSNTIRLSGMGYDTFNAQFEGRNVFGVYRERLSADVYIDYEIRLEINESGKSFSGGVSIAPSNVPPEYQPMKGSR